MSHDATLAASELYANLHLCHRRQVLNPPQVNLSQRDKDRLLLLPIGGNDLFGPLAPKVKDLRKDSQEKALSLAEAIEQMKGLRPKALCWRHVLLGPWLMSLPWTWPAPNKPETPMLELLPGSCQVSGEGRIIVSGTSSRPILSQSPERNSSPRTRLQHLIQHHLSNRVKETSDLQSDGKGGSGSSKFPKGMVDPVTNPRNSQLLVGGKLAAFHHQWAQHFPNHHELIRKVSQGLLISFWDEAPPFIHGPLVLSYNNKAEAISLAVQKLLKSQAIEEVQDTSSPAFYGRLFFVPKPDGFLCPIIDLKVLNQYLEVLSFKMEILFSIAAVLPPREWMIKIDLKDAYPHIIVPPNIHKYFQLVVNSVTNQSRALSFGLFTAPRELIKTLAPVALLLGSWDIQIQATLIGFSAPVLHNKLIRMRRELCSYQRH